MTLRAGIILLLLCPAQALAGNCAELGRLADLAATGFASGNPGAELTEVESCDLSRNVGGSQTYLCSWAFPYRAPGAAAVFDMLDRTIPVCIRGATAMPEDSSVNHPDSYELSSYRRGNVVISASLKDKAAISKSLVFLRIDAE